MEKLEHLVFGVVQQQTNQFHLLQLMTIYGTKLQLHLKALVIKVF